MINEKEFSRLRKEIENYDQEREKLIKKSREILKLSKQIIYAVHRGEMEKAGKLVKQIEVGKERLDKISKHRGRMESEGSYRIAVQEYVEAILYYNFIKGRKLVKLKVWPELFVLGLADLTGELVRKAVFLAGKGKTAEVVQIKELVNQIYGELLKFDFRDNETRRKVDAVKYELRKLEDLVLEMKLRRG